MITARHLGLPLFVLLIVLGIAVYRPLLPSGVSAEIGRASDSAHAPAILQGVCGDQNNDGIVNVLDLIIDFQIAVGSIQPTQTQLELSDLNQDGEINVVDVIMGLQFIVGLIPSLEPCGPPEKIIAVSGRILFDDETPVEGAQVSANVAPEGSVAILLAVPLSQTVTDAAGNFALEVGPVALPVRVLVEVSFQPDSLPLLETAKWLNAAGTVLDVGIITIPNPQGTEVSLDGGAGQSDDGSVNVTGMPAEVDRLFMRSYDPDLNAEAFPGEFAEMGSIPLNSAVFLWMEALDAQGNPVEDLSQAATVRTLVPRSQWVDLEDITADTDRIEIPIYFYNEDLNVWEEQGVGWLEHDSGMVLPEDAQPLILDGSLPGQIFATFETNHLSWMNVDYPFIGPWTLSHLDKDKRNTDCLSKAAQLAQAIALSPRGQAAYAKVNNPGAKIGDELADGKGPELQSKNLAGSNAEYRGESGGSKDLFLGDDLWSGCDKPGKKKDTILCLASAILHETAHWKDDVKKTGPDTIGEEGDQLEKDLFGGIARCGPDGTFQKDGKPVDDKTKDDWLDPSYWKNLPAGPTSAAVQETSPLEITISTAQQSFELNDPLPVQVELTNASSEEISLFDRSVLEDHPFRFDIIFTETGERIAFLGPEIQILIADTDFIPLGPGETLIRTFDLRFDLEGAPRRYKLIQSGDYQLSAVYSSSYGLPETTSNTISFILNPGGSISGTVTGAQTGEPISGASIKVTLGGQLLTTAATDASGDYSFSELPPGIYTLEARAGGFLRSTKEAIEVVGGVNTVLDFSLPLLLLGLGEVFPADPDALAKFEFNGDVKDSNGTGRDAILLGGEFVATIWGQGLHVFPPSPGGAIGIDWSEFAGLLVHPYTVEVVLAPLDTVGWRKIFSFEDASDAGWYYKNQGIQAFPNPVVGTGQVLADERHYIAFVSTASDQVDIYFQGVLLGSTDASFTAPPAEAIFFRDDTSTGRREQLDAVVEALRISGITRTQGEIEFIQQRLESR